jgi:6-phosphogluconolactonase
MAPQILIGDRGGLEDALSADFEIRGRRALERRGVFSVALSGGSLATEFFPALARLSFDWSRTEFFWADERAVPPSDPESNYGIAQSLWLGPANVPPSNVHRMRGEDPDLQRAASDYAGELVDVAGNPPTLDFVMLGVGPDGHIASLFPGHPVSRDERHLVAVVDDAPKPPPRRLTLTMARLVSAEWVVVVALGKAKAGAIQNAIEQDETTPIGVLAERSRNMRFLLDEGAASLLSNRGKVGR